MNEYIYNDFFNWNCIVGSGRNVGFCGNSFFSYNTIIGMKFHTAEGDYLCYSGYRFSMTTSKHINSLLGACPYGKDYVIPVPFQYEYPMELNGKGIADLFAAWIRDADFDMLTNDKTERKKFLSIAEGAEKFSENIHPLPLSVLKKIKEFNNGLTKGR